MSIFLPANVRVLLVRLLLAAGLSVVLTAQEVVVDGPRATKVDEWLRRAVPFGLHCALLVEVDGDVVLRKGYGTADRATGRPITPRTRFDVGSLAKQFTAAAAASLVADGRLKWSDRLGELLQDVPADKRAITLHQLLTHTSGLPYMPPTGSLLSARMVAAPGERFAYSNVGYALLARIVAESSGRSFENVLNGLFERAGVASITPTGSATSWDDLACGYIDSYSHGTPDRMTVDERLRGATGYACTVDELHRWLRALEGGRVVAKDIAERMLSNQAGSGRAYGYGWFVHKTVRGTSIIRHMGDYNGFSAEVRRYPEERRTLVFLSNSAYRSRGLREAAVNPIALLLAGEVVPAAPLVVPLDRAAVATAAGVYRTASGVEFDLQVADDRIWLATADQAGLDALFPRKSGAASDELVKRYSARTRRLLDLLMSKEVGKSELIDPAWIGAARDLGRVLASCREACGARVDEVSVSGVAVLDTNPEFVRTQARFSGPAGTRWLSLVWTTRGAIGCATAPRPIARDFRATGPLEFAAFDLYTGVTVTCRLEEGHSTLHVAHGEQSLRAARQ